MFYVYPSQQYFHKELMVIYDHILNITRLSSPNIHSHKHYGCDVMNYEFKCLTRVQFVVTHQRWTDGTSKEEVKGLGMINCTGKIKLSHVHLQCRSFMKQKLGFP